MGNREIGFIFQAFNLIGDLTVYENVELPLTYRGMLSSERKKRVIEVARKSRHGSPHETLSIPTFRWSATESRCGPCTGRRSRQSYWPMNRPETWIRRNGEAVIELLRELHQEGATICMVTHDPRYARYADRTVHLFDGKVVDEPALEEDTDRVNDSAPKHRKVLRKRRRQDLRPSPR